MDKIQNKCRGCKMFDKENDECEIKVIPYMSEVGHCPCKTCLIKGMCENECETFIQYKYDIGMKQWKE